MKAKNVPIGSIKENEDNPRFIKESKFEKLVASIKEFPQMLELRPIIVDEEMKILGGNMRHKAAIEAGLQTIPIIIAEGLTEEQKNEFVIKDNVSFGEWDWDILANDFENDTLVDWGLDVWQPNNDLLQIEGEEKETEVERAKKTDNEYSSFELVMLHENKLILLDAIHSVKNGFLFETNEEALMEIIRTYNNK